MNRSISKPAKLLLTLLFSTLAISHVNASDDFDRLYTQAESEMKTEFGGFYSMQLNGHIAESHTNVMDSCTATHKKSSKQPFSAVFEINSNGTIKAFHLESKANDFAACLKSSFVGLEVPMPPFDGYLSPFNWGSMR